MRDATEAVPEPAKAKRAPAGVKPSEPAAKSPPKPEPQPAAPAEAAQPRPAKRKRSRRRKPSGRPAAEPITKPAAEPIEEPTVETVAAPTTEPASVAREPVVEAEPVLARPAAEPPAEAEPGAAKRKRRPRRRKKRAVETAGAQPTAAAPEATIALPAEEPPEAFPEEPPEALSEELPEALSEESPETPPEPAKPTAAPAAKRSAPRPDTGFGAMALSDAMFAALDKAGYLEPTPVQAGLIPRAMLGDDLMGQARTGTGKTAAFAIPILEGLEHGTKKRGPQALVLVPTRELAVQVRDEFVKLAVGQKGRVVAIYGGKPIRQQTEKLQRGVEVVVGTPGRIMDHMSRHNLFLGDLRQVVLDEADRMLDIGFRPDIEKILRQCPESRQTLLFSATLPPPVLRLAQRYMRDPEAMDFSATDVAVETIEQSYFTIDPGQKYDLLVKLLEREQPAQAIIFCRTRRGTERISLRLSKRYPDAACIHGDLPQRTRDRVMEGFRAGKIRLLLATDVMGRGIDVTRISHIINFDVPEFCDDYVHRVGRTGRMGREGMAFTFVTPEEGPQLTRIEMRINRLLKRDEIAGFAAVPMANLPEGTVAPEAEPAESKPVFGRPRRKVRRAL